MYTIKEIADLSGVSPRTLRFYQEQEILMPAAFSESGYRLYGEEEVDRLALILLYRSFDLSIKTIRQMLNQPDDKNKRVLMDQKEQLLAKRAQLDQLVALIDANLNQPKGGNKVANKNDFEMLREQAIKENEAQYGNEIREKYGETIINETNQKFRKMSQEEVDNIQETEGRLLKNLSEYLTKPTKELAELIFADHKKWLGSYLPHYELKIHQGIAAMYLIDERFTAYYDQKSGTGATEALVKIIEAQ
ncbi:MerR family transcriptional regulator [Enterococcus alishanensis]|uniref:MerR family transcriptional regulator n=1 Tax=Enterococcus alishanensis TaxID=1303817 RepID=A0ABS6TCZ2_9ENTE|nr:MerR family transcriptional regulator [Enterococcus alishanensis]MBV7390811.1 MerR family transcriptional regulator [Enterococcus alishanensis]